MPAHERTETTIPSAVIPATAASARSHVAETRAPLEEKHVDVETAFERAAPQSERLISEAPAPQSERLISEAAAPQSDRVSIPENSPTPAPSPPAPPITSSAQEVTTPRNLPEIPPVASALPPDSSLVLVETRHSAPPSDNDATAETSRPKRARPPRVEIAAEPLEMVETQHKDATTPGP